MMSLSSDEEMEDKKTFIPVQFKVNKRQVNIEMLLEETWDRMYHEMLKQTGSLYTEYNLGEVVNLSTRVEIA